MSSEKTIIINLIASQIKKISFHELSYYPNPDSYDKKKIAELDLSNYSTRSEVKNTIDVDTLDFSEIDDLAGLKSDIGE